MAMAKVYVVYYSGFGHTKIQAEAVFPPFIVGFLLQFHVESGNLPKTNVAVTGSGQVELHPEMKPNWRIIDCHI